VFTSTTTVTGNGSYISSPFTAHQSGTYRWVASYNGDTLNTGAGPSPCGAAGETVTVSPAVEPDIKPGPEPAPKFERALTTKRKPKPKPPKPPPPLVTG
jgi:hypothetical protein